MTIERRMLLEPDGVDDFERQLLEAGSREAPRDSVRESALVAMGIGKGGGSGGGGAAPARGAKRAKAPRIAAAVVVVGLAALVWNLSSRDRTDRSPPSGAEPVAIPNPTSVPATVEVTPAPVASVEPPAAIASSPRPPTVPAKTSEAQGASNGESGLAAEVAALEIARRAISQGDKGGAVRALDDYRRKFPAGMMRQEAAVLRIEALAKGGDTGAARALADQFLQSNPKSPHAQRIRRLVGEEPAP